MGGLPELLREPIRGLALLRTPAAVRATDDIGADAPGLPIVAGDLWVDGGQGLLGLLILLGGVGDEVALVQEVGDDPVGELHGALGVLEKTRSTSSHRSS